MSTPSSAEPFADVPPPEKHVKRPPNAWVLYRKIKSEEYREAHPDRKFTLPEMSGIMSRQWAEEPEEEIRRFEELAREKSVEHFKRHPKYRYQPRRRSPGDEQKKPRKVKEGRVTKPRRTQKGKVPSTTTDIPTTEATNAGHGWPETNGPSLASNDDFWLGFVASLNDPRALASFSHNTMFSLDSLNSNILNREAQPMAYSDRSYAGSSHVVMPPFAATQMNAYQLMSNGGTIASNDQSHTGGSFQIPNAYKANPQDEQTIAVAAGPIVPHATTSQNDGSFSWYNCFEYSTSDITHAISPVNEQVSLGVHPIPDFHTVFENFADILAYDEKSMTWGI